MNNKWYSLDVNHTFEVNIPKSYLAEKMIQTPTYVKDFELLKEKKFFYEFFDHNRIFNSSFLLSFRFSATSGSIVPTGPSRSRVALNTNLRTILLLYPLFIFVMNAVYFVSLANGANFHLSLGEGIFGLGLFLLVLLRSAKTGGRHLPHNYPIYKEGRKGIS
ncbi:MAG: hypothetical protein AAF655_06850 [Bacteroidota bacterium]